MNIPEIFAENVFNEKAMKAALSPEVYRSLKKAVNENEPLDFNVAQEVADAMKNWAKSCLLPARADVMSPIIVI